MKTNNKSEIRQVYLENFKDQISSEFLIPNYQRKYSWTEDEIIKLLEDIYYNETEDYFLGSVILKNSGYTKTVIDGQQRISTILLIMKVLELKCKINYSTNKFSFDSKNIIDSKILESILNIKKIEEFTLDKNHNYYKAIKIIYKYIKNLTNEERNVFVKKFNKTFIISVILTDDTNEHKIFATINSTGKPLTILELIKSFLFSKFEEFNINDGFMKYEKLVEYIENIPSKNIQNDIVRSFIAYETYNLVNKKEQILFNEFLELYKTLKTKEEFETLWNKFYMFCSYYCLILSDEFANSFQSMIILKKALNTYSTLIIDILMHNTKFKVNYDIVSQIYDFNKNEIEKALKVIEYFRINLVFCTTNEKQITRLIPQLRKEINKDNYADNLYNELKERNKIQCLDDVIKSLFTNQIYEINNELTCSLLKRLEYYQNDEKYDSKIVYSVEHIMPQKNERWLQENDQKTKEISPFLNTLANLTILKDKHNSELSNHTFKTKIQKLQSRMQLSINNKLLKYDEWNLENMQDRANYLIEIIYKIWNFQENIPIIDLKLLKPNISSGTYDYKVDWLKSSVRNNINFDFNYDNVVKALELYLVEGIKNVDKALNIDTKNNLINKLLSILFDVDNISMMKESSNFNENYIKNNFDKFIKDNSNKLNQLIEDVNK